MDVLIIGGLVLVSAGLGLLVGRFLAPGESAKTGSNALDPIGVGPEGRQGQDPDHEWPELIGTEGPSSNDVCELSEDQRLQLAIIEEQIRRLIR
jgi:hypothetical protein